MSRGGAAPPGGSCRLVDVLGASAPETLANPLLPREVQPAVDPLVADADASHTAAESSEHGDQRVSEVGTTV